MPDLPSDKVQALWEAQQRAVRAQAELNLAEAEIERLEYEVLPDLYLQHGVTEVKLPNGCKAIKTLDAKGSFPDGDKDPDIAAKAAEWYVGHQYQDLLETKVEAKWGRGERDKAVAFYDTVRGDNSALVRLKDGCHWATHCKTVKEHVLKHPEEVVPLDVLGVTIRPRVRITVKPKEAE
jgi:hypothetical protein